ncbi:MAG: response regulator [Chloroherpetonaceae bacterium]|nr:response regulator [Chloroherpetonaceae bacterium]MCS7210626.1 response regulator [Chloroherpetonaceae bacterium]MDW8019922.1 response regulator [Chloroherpetonaceae bacterium]
MKELSHILVVDDEPLMLNSLRDLLDFDYKVHTAQNGFEALEILRQHPIKVIISDERMPEMPGHELLRQAKTISPDTIRVLLTGYADLESVIKSVNAGEIFRYLNKPCRPEMLQSVVRLGVQIYDRITALRTSAVGVTKMPVAPVSAPPKPSVRPSVLFIGYSKEEIAHLVSKLEDIYEILAADTVEEAFQIFSKKEISVIVSELQLGEYDGVDFLQTLKQERPQAIIIILTDAVDVKLIVRAVNELNVFKYIPKPTTEEQLERALREATAKSSEYLHYHPESAATNKPAGQTVPKEQATEQKEKASSLKSNLQAAHSLLKKN